MKKFLLGVVLFVSISAVAIYVFREPLGSAVAEQITADMFADADRDAFSPGIAIGATFPAIAAVHKGVEVTSIAPFMGRSGLLFVANRSVEW